MTLLRSTLREVVQDQRARFISLPRGIERELLVEARKHYASPQVVVITGLRRAGKSTLAAQIAEDLGHDNYYYLNFEDERLSGFDVSDFQALQEIFIELYRTRKTFIFDEVQVVEGWEKFVRRLSDSGAKLFVTGSNAHLLSREFGTKLTGRTSYLELFPFSFREYLRFKGIAGELSQDSNGRAIGARMIREYMREGGIPLALAYPELNILSDLYQDVLYRDIVVRYNLDSAKPIRDLSSFLLNNPTTLQAFSKLKQLIQVGSVTTITNYIDYLESAWLVFSLNIYDRSTRRQQLQPKKIACIDTGLISTLAVSLDSKVGRIFENLVFLELRRSFKEMHYYKTKDGEEIDFYIPERNLLLQVCLDLSDQSTRARELGSLVKALDELPGSKGIVITMEANEAVPSIDRRIEIVAAYRFFGGKVGSF